MDKMTILTDVDTAKNMLVFMNRAQLQGQEAEVFLKCKAAILQGIQESQKVSESGLKKVK